MGLRVYDVRSRRDDRPREIVCLLDEAVDADAMGVKGIERYRDTLDMGAVVVRPGATPVVFHVRPLTHSQYRSASIAAQREAERESEVRGGRDLAMSVIGRVLAEEAFHRGCQAVVDVERVLPDGSTKLGALERERWDEIPHAWVAWIGNVILGISKPPAPPPADDVGKSSPPS